MPDVEKSRKPETIGAQAQTHDEPESSEFKSYIRVFKYADKTSRILYSVAFIAAIAAGVTLPLMDLVFGKFVTTFTDFAMGRMTPGHYMSQVSRYA